MLAVVLSSGRCGTQWLTETLRELHGDQLEVEHEPIGPLYSPRRFFRLYEEPEAVLEVDAVRAHLDRIASLDKPYVETGWPLLGALPLLAHRLPDKLLVIHLTRHPVPSALSHLAHNSYAGSARDDAYTRLATLGPTDPRVFQTSYAARWKALSAYEKCLFWVTEVAAFGLEFEERFPAIPLIRVKSEQMLAGDRPTLERLVACLGLDWDDRWVERTGTRVDRWNHRTDADVDPLAIRHHAFAMATAERLGYDPAAFDAAALRARYHGVPDSGLDRIGRFTASANQSRTLAADS